MLWSIRNGKQAGPNPWGARTLEWMIPSPPPYYNFKKIPTVYGLPYDFRSRCRIKGLDDELTDSPPPVAAGAPLGIGCRRSVPHATTHVSEVDQLYIETRDLRLQGFLLFLVSDCVLFSSFIFAYLYLRNSGQGWPPPGIQRLDVAFAALNSVVLFGSGVTMHYALENWKHGNFMRYMLLMLATIVLGAGFLGGQAYEYTHLIFGEHVTWSGSGIFGASFFTLTGMHGFHVFSASAT